jgi:predicted pyridoxine 5'-phosphate oxidase superfamily flavin-nucleotide-binding protein
MASQFAEMRPEHRRFVARQHVFFVASAAAGGRVNLSPKDGKALRVLDANTAVYLDQTGSGNETAAHMLADGRLTFMFCAFEGPPLILRLYGRGRILPKASADYRTLLAEQFSGEAPSGARQMVQLDVELVQTSCGYNVPLNH